MRSTRNIREAADDAGEVIPVGHRERGASLTEFAIVVPLFVVTVYGSLYLCDLGIFKCKAQEIAHYGAWAFTERPLSNYGDENFDHTTTFNDARTDITAELFSCTTTSTVR